MMKYPLPIDELKRANDLKEREVAALERLAYAQSQIAKVATGPSRLEQWWYGPGGKAGFNSRRNY